MFSNEREVTRESHPALFSLLLSSPQSARVADQAFVLTAPTGLADFHGAIRACLSPGDEVMVFQLSGAAWSVRQPDLDDRLKMIFS